MLTLWIENERWLAVAQSGVAFLLVLITTLVARRQGIRLVKETTIAMLRGVVQIVAVGSVLLLMFSLPTWASLLVLAVMILAAGWMGSQRIKNLEGAFPLVLTGVGLGSLIVMVSAVVLGILKWDTQSLIPVGSMVLANAMNTAILAIERFQSDIRSRTGEIETALALGACPQTAVGAQVQKAIEASLIPRVNSLRSLGIVWIPGAMTGLVLAGADPVYAALYQFVIMAMIYMVGATTAIFCILQMRKKVFSPAMQLLLRGEG